jgi:hypothetical protein
MIMSPLAKPALSAGPFGIICQDKPFLIDDCAGVHSFYWNHLIIDVVKKPDDVDVDRASAYLFDNFKTEDSSHAIGFTFLITLN